MKKIKHGKINPIDDIKIVHKKRHTIYGNESTSNDIQRSIRTMNWNIASEINNLNPIKGEGEEKSAHVYSGKFILYFLPFFLLNIIASNENRIFNLIKIHTVSTMKKRRNKKTGRRYSPRWCP